MHIPENLEACVHALACANAQERTEKALRSHLWMTLRLFSGGLKANEELLTA